MPKIPIIAVSKSETEDGIHRQVAPGQAQTNHLRLHSSFNPHPKAGWSRLRAAVRQARIPLYFSTSIIILPEPVT
jgi:hypothetical protein